MLLLENTDPHMWKIRNGRNQESVVPATLVVIRGPCGDAIDAAVRLLYTLYSSILNTVVLLLFLFLF